MTGRVKLFVLILLIVSITVVIFKYDFFDSRELDIPQYLLLSDDIKNSSTDQIPENIRSVYFSVERPVFELEKYYIEILKTNGWDIEHKTRAETGQYTIAAINPKYLRQVFTISIDRDSYNNSFSIVGISIRKFIQ